MNLNFSLFLFFNLLTVFSYGQNTEQEGSSYQYFNKSLTDSVPSEILIAFTDEEFLQYGVKVAYMNLKGDVIIPFGKYAYLGTDTLIHYANVIEYSKDSIYGRCISIDQNQNILYDIVKYDNGPDYFEQGLSRVLRNGKMGFSNHYGQIIIPCIYDFAWPFKNGKAKVTFTAKKVIDKQECHSTIISNEWFYINKEGNKIKE